MPYNSNIPQPNDDLSVSQPQILANFSTIATAFNLNHGNFNAVDEGKHRYVQMPNQNATPPTTIANETGIYCNTSTLTNQPELFFIKQNGTTAPPPLNGANGYEITSSNYIANGGWTRLPSGILLKWGEAIAAPPATTLNFAFPVAATIPVFQAIYQVVVTDMANPPRNYSITALTTATFNIISSYYGSTPGITGIGLRYLAIGV